MLGERLIYSFFLPIGVINGIESPYKKKNNVCARQTSFSAIFLLNKITVPNFQIIHIRNTTLNLCLNGGLEGRRKVQTPLHGLFTFWH